LWCRKKSLMSDACLGGCPRAAIVARARLFEDKLAVI